MHLLRWHADGVPTCLFNRPPGRPQLRNSKETLQLEKQHHSQNVEQMKASLMRLENDKRDLILEVARLSKEVRAWTACGGTR